MTPVDKALDAGYRAAFEATKLGMSDGPEYTGPSPDLARVFNTFFAAALRALEPTPEMVEAAINGLNQDKGTAWVERWTAIVSAALSKLAEQVEGNR